MENLNQFGAKASLPVSKAVFLMAMMLYCNMMTVLGNTNKRWEGGPFAFPVTDEGRAIGWTITTNRPTEAMTCSISSVTATNISEINDCSTPECDDDVFTADVVVVFNDPPGTGTLDLTGDATASISVSQLSGSSHTFQVAMPADGTNIWLTASFSAEPTCRRINLNAGENGQQAPEQCGLCSDDLTASGKPNCWPDELTTIVCENSINYAPDPEHLEHTPIRYLKVILHIFQREDDSQLGEWIINPNDPGNFTNSPEHMSVIQSWFNDPGGLNGLMGSPCEEGAHESPYIPDTRIRFLNEGIENVDVFFHPDNKGWGMGYHGCNGLGDNLDSDYWSSDNPDARDRYVLNPDSNHPQYQSLTSLETKNALHIFITGCKWVPVAPGNEDIPDENDCYSYCDGGMTSDMRCESSTSVTVSPIQARFGLYDEWLGEAGNCANANYPGDAGLGKRLGGEFFHVLGLDHISPLQAHRLHDVGYDGCLDTPWQSDYNWMGCAYATRCGFTQCQIGRMHYVLSRVNPAFERFPLPGGGFSRTQRNCEITEPDIVINNGENIIWKSNRQLRSNVLVKTGGKLTIKCRVGMPAGATITVETGGRLLINGGEVYNNCTGRWEGVVVEGNSSLPQGLPSTNQGYFGLSDDDEGNGRGILRGANTSIHVQGGGMVFAYNSDIIDCGGAIFEKYDRHNMSYFHNCEFSVDGNVYDFGNNSFFHVALLGVRDLEFKACSFSASDVPPASLGLTTGITGTGSIFKVINNSSFRGMETGIAAYNGLFSPFPPTFVVDDCSFQGNNTGIFALGVDNFTVTNSTFEVGSSSFSNDYSTGLMMDNCSGYTVEENQFSGADETATGRIGILVEDSGNDANLIRGNRFDYLEIANHAQNDNRGLFTGLQYHCNTNGGHNPFDFYVIGLKNQGIHINQGNGQATLNTFSHLGAIADGDFRNDVGLISYFHKNDPAHEPQNPTGIATFEVGTLNTCPQDETCCEALLKLSPNEWQKVENDFNVARTGWQNEKTALMALMDGGDTDALLGTINGATSQNAGQVVQGLLALSPYLTVESLSAAIAKKSVLTESSVAQILNANPESLREAELRSLVTSSFFSTTADSILANAANQTARTAEENLVGQYRATMQRKADLLIRDILLDTLVTDLPLLRTWLANKESLEASYAIVGTYIAEGHFDTVALKMAEIPQIYPLDDDELEEHAHLSDLANLWEGVSGDSIPLDSLDQQAMATLQSIAESSHRRAGASAQGILNTWYGAHYRVVPLMPGGGGQQGLLAPPTGKRHLGIANHLAAFPNPARNSVTFHWNLPDGLEYGTIIVSDLQGRTIETMEITGQSGKREWDTSNLGRGIYLYQLLLSDGTTETVKLTIIK